MDGVGACQCGADTASMAICPPAPPALSTLRMPSSWKVFCGFKVWFKLGVYLCSCLSLGVELDLEKTFCGSFSPEELWFPWGGIWAVFQTGVIEAVQVQSVGRSSALGAETQPVLVSSPKMGGWSKQGRWETCLLSLSNFPCCKPCPREHIRDLTYIMQLVGKAKFIHLNYAGSEEGELLFFSGLLSFKLL